MIVTHVSDRQQQVNNAVGFSRNGAWFCREDGRIWGGLLAATTLICDSNHMGGDDESCEMQNVRESLKKKICTLSSRYSAIGISAVIEDILKLVLYYCIF